jgi:hypothetical protein
MGAGSRRALRRDRPGERADRPDRQTVR